jgi:hypothetical protein
MLALFASTLSGARVSISNANIVDLTLNPTSCSVSYQLTSAGVANAITTSSGTAAIENWVSPTSAAGANYQARATVNTGTLSSGTTGAWTALSSTQTWTVTRATIGSKACNFTVEIRATSSGVVLDTVTIDLSANVDP